MSGLDLGQMIAHGFTSRNATETLTNKTLTAPIINGARSGTAWDIADRAPIAPTLDLDFANQRYRVLDGSVGLRQIALTDILTYTGSGRTYTGARGTLIAQSANEPRITFDPVTGAGQGLSVWGARTNLLTYSQDFDNVAWGKTRCTVTANAAAAPDGTAAADKLVDDATAANSHFLAFTVAALTGVHTVSVFAKASGRNIGFLLAGGTVSRAVFFNLSTTGVTYAEVIGGVSPVDVGVTITPHPGGWYRCTATWTADGQTSIRLMMDDGSGTSSYNGDGSSGVFIWGAQLEAASSAGPYIPTTTAAVTAPADVPTITGSNFSKWFNPLEGTFVYRHSSVAGADGGVSQGRHGVSDGTNNNRINMQGSSASTVAGGVSDGSASSGVNHLGDVWRAVAYSSSGLSFCTSGSAVVTDAAFTLPAGLNQMHIGQNSPATSSTVINGTVSRVLHFPRRLSDSVLQALTA